MNQGQMCTAGARTFVHEDIYDEFIEKSIARTSKKIVADPFQMYSEQGPVVSIAFIRIMGGFSRHSLKM